MSVHVAEPQIKKHCLVTGNVEQAQSFLSACGLVDVMTVVLEMVGHGQTDEFLVLNDENGSLRRIGFDAGLHDPLFYHREG